MEKLKILNENAFGNNLKTIRKNMGISQKNFALKLGIPQPTLSAYESGKMKPTIDVVIGIADKCNISMDELCRRKVRELQSYTVCVCTERYDEIMKGAFNFRVPIVINGRLNGHRKIYDKNTKYLYFSPDSEQPYGGDTIILKEIDNNGRLLGREAKLKVKFSTKGLINLDNKDEGEHIFVICQGEDYVKGSALYYIDEDGREIKYE